MTTLSLRVRPRAKRSELLGFRADGVLQVAVAAPAEDGRANRAVMELLAAALGVRLAQLRLVRGVSSRGKVVAVDGLEPDQVRGRLESVLSARVGKERDGG